MVNEIEREIYHKICDEDGIKAKEIARKLNQERKVINHYLYCSPLIHDLCYQDNDYQWHGIIRQEQPHSGLEEFGGYYSTVAEFLGLGEETWLEQLKEGCRHIGRNLNDTRGLIHSFLDSRETMISLFQDLEKMQVETGDWEILFELRIKIGRRIRIYADVLVVTKSYVFSLEFKMNDHIEEKEVAQAGKYSKYMEVIFGPKYEIISGLVLTHAKDFFTHQMIGDTTGEIPVCSGDMLFNLFDEYLNFLS